MSFLKYFVSKVCLRINLPIIKCNSDVNYVIRIIKKVFRRIGRDLSLTCAKMEKLTQMAKKKSLFQDHSEEMEDLSQVLKQVRLSS